MNSTVIAEVAEDLGLNELMLADAYRYWLAIRTPMERPVQSYMDVACYAVHRLSNEEKGEPCACRWDGDGNLVGEACSYHSMVMPAVIRKEVVDQIKKDMGQWKGQKFVRERAIAFLDKWEKEQ